MVHHRHFASKGRRNIWSHLHTWFGRILLILSIVNGGIGIQYAANSPNGEIGYGVTAGVIFLIYAGVIGIWYATRLKQKTDVSNEEEEAVPGVREAKSE